jgi:hypothetical protein
MEVLGCRIWGRGPKCHMNKSRNDPRHPTAHAEPLDVRVLAWIGVSRPHEALSKEFS